MKKLLSLGAALLAVSVVSAQAQTYVSPAPAPGYAPAPAPYAAAPYPATPAYAPAPVYAAPAPTTYCQPYSDKFTMGSEVRIVRGTACMHPDGSWELHPTDAGMRYITRNNGLFLIPSQPFAVVIGDDHRHHHHDHH